MLTWTMGSVDVMWLGFVGKGWDAGLALAFVGRLVANGSKKWIE